MEVILTNSPRIYTQVSSSKGNLTWTDLLLAHSWLELLLSTHYSQDLQFVVGCSVLWPCTSWLYIHRLWIIYWRDSEGELTKNLWFSFFLLPHIKVLRFDCGNSPTRLKIIHLQVIFLTLLPRSCAASVKYNSIYVCMMSSVSEFFISNASRAVILTHKYMNYNTDGPWQWSGCVSVIHCAKRWTERLFCVQCLCSCHIFICVHIFTTLWKYLLHKCRDDEILLLILSSDD